MTQEHVDEVKPCLQDFANVELADVINVTAMQEMMDDYYALTGIGVGIIDLKGTVLVRTGWQDICVNFHRAVPESCAFCHESDISLSSGVPPGTFREYRCKNNMWDIGTPIMLGDRHIGNIFLGQFFYDDEKPDYQLFRAQARRFGYDEAEYLAALDRVPRWSRETVRKAMGFYSKLARMISKANYNNFILADTLARREQAEEKLRESEKKFAKIFNAAPSLLAISTIAEGRYIDINESFERFTGYGRDEVIGRTSLELEIWEAEARTRFIEAIAKEGMVRDFEADFRIKNGEHRVGLISAEVIEIKEEKCLLVLVNDITERKQAEVALSESEERHRSILQTAMDGFWRVDMQGRLLEVNESYCRMSGYSVEELLTMRVTDIEAVETADMTAAHFRKFVELGEDRFESRHRRKDGSLFDVEISAMYRSIAGGQIVVFLRDISARKRTEEAQRTQFDQMCAIFDSIDAAVSVADMETFELIYLNNYGVSLFGSGWEGKRCYEVLQAGQEIPCDFCSNDKLVRDGIIQPPFIWEFQNTQTGQWFQCIDRALTWPDGRLTRMQVGFDITDRKRVESELQQTKVAAEAANIAKSRFLATMSHEIRTPMNGVIGMLELLQHTEMSREQQEYAESAKKYGIELVHLLNDILDLSKIEADKLELELSPFDLKKVISDTINLLSLQAREKGVKLSASMDNDVPTALKGDAGRLRQLIINLVGNAIKFTPEGYVTLHIWKSSEDERSATLRFHVSDSGIGIAADKLERIFEPFTQVDSSTTRKFGGSGLGLAICKRLVELMGGSIGVESQEGEGSTFWFSVVMEKQTERDVSSPQPVSAPHASVGVRKAGSLIRLLLAEDDPAAQRIVPKLLRNYGYLVDVAADGREALQALENNDYTLVLMDCMMPEMNGYEVTAVIRDPASKVRRHDIPIIALTGNAMKEDLDRCVAAGMNDHLSKPLLLDDLLSKLDDLLKTKI